MTNLLLLSVQMVMALMAFIIIFRVYLQRWFTAAPFALAVLPLLLLHVFRYLGLTLIAPGQVEASVSRTALQVMAYGDLAAGVAALLAVLAVVSRSSLATASIVLFTIVGFGDFISVGYTAAQAGIVDAEIGTMRFFLVTFAPALILSQIYVAYRLFGHVFGSKRDQMVSAQR